MCPYRSSPQRIYGYIWLIFLLIFGGCSLSNSCSNLRWVGMYKLIQCIKTHFKHSHTYSWIYVYIHIYIHTYTYICVYIHLQRTARRVRISQSTNIHMYIHAHTIIYIHTCIGFYDLLMVSVVSSHHTNTHVSHVYVCSIICTYVSTHSHNADLYLVITNTPHAHTQTFDHRITIRTRLVFLHVFNMCFARLDID
jgi:hypothetical protein